jgi:hypothetical protein
MSPAFFVVPTGLRLITAFMPKQNTRPPRGESGNCKRARRPGSDSQAAWVSANARPAKTSSTSVWKMWLE